MPKKNRYRSLLHYIHFNFKFLGGITLNDWSDKVETPKTVDYLITNSITEIEQEYRMKFAYEDLLAYIYIYTFSYE